MDYQIPQGCHVIPQETLDLRTDAAIDQEILNPKPVTSEKNVWFFWHSGFANMHGYTQRNVRAWHRRFSRHGWVIRVLDLKPGSPFHVSNFLDVKDPNTFPHSFIDGTLAGTFALQHSSDLVRLPLLLKYGGIYADVGVIQIGDLERLWWEIIANPESPFEVLSYRGDTNERMLTNYFMGAQKNNPFWDRCHRLLLALWNEDGGKQNTTGMHTSPLLKGVPLLSTDGLSFTEDGKTYGPEECSRLLTDYIIQGQVIAMVMGLIDEEGGWNGPEYSTKHIYGIDYMEGSQLINVFTDWDGTRAFELMSLSLPKQGERETEDQKLAREIVEACLQRSFGFKLATGIILKMIGPTLASMWRSHENSDNVPGTYADCLRHGVVYWTQDELPKSLAYTSFEPYKRGPLLREV